MPISIDDQISAIAGKIADLKQELSALRQQRREYKASAKPPKKPKDVQDRTADYEQVFRLHDENGLTFRQIGEQTGRSVTTVSKRWMRALAYFRQADAHPLQARAKEIHASLVARSTERFKAEQAMRAIQWPPNAPATKVLPMPGQEFMLRDTFHGHEVGVPGAGVRLVCTMRKDDSVVFEHEGSRRLTWADMCVSPPT